MRKLFLLLLILFPFAASAQSPFPVIISSSQNSFWAVGDAVEIFFNYDSKELRINDIRTTGMCIWIVSEVHIFPDSGSFSQIIINWDDQSAKLIRK